VNRKIPSFGRVHPFGGFNMSGTDSKAGGRDYLLLSCRQVDFGKNQIVETEAIAAWRQMPEYSQLVQVVRKKSRKTSDLLPSLRIIFSGNGEFCL